MAATTGPKVENPPKTLAPPSSEQQLPTGAASADAAGESKGNKVNSTATTSGSEASSALSDAQKKMRRAERFGMPVQLSEEEKRSSRAERFGTGEGSNQLKNSDEQKLKARAERFGLVQCSPTDDVAKKKARLERFGTASKMDSVEEEKRKARAVRFLQTPASSISEADAKRSIEPKNAVAGEAGGVM